LLSEHFAEPTPHRLWMLSGGGTPLAAYARLAEQPPEVRPDACVLLSDERAVPDDSPKSNQGSIFPLLQKAGFTAGQLVHVETAVGASAAATHLELRLAEVLETHTPRTGLLGLGADGHTAGIFSREQITDSGKRLAMAVQRPDGMEGITAAPAFLSRFPRLVVLVSGSAKHAPLHAWIQCDDTLVARAALREAPTVEIWCDHAAWTGKDIA